jgi:peptidoglycan/xylan/chitin deacetylase (PgdA/CDA1 family)
LTVSARRAILTYHSLDSSGSVISVAPDCFRRQLQALKDSRVPVVPLRSLTAAPAPAVALTFDDGFQNFAEVAAPELQRHGFPATVFLVSGYCGRSNQWPSQRPGLPLLPLMNWATIRDLSRAGVEFGAHTETHPHLSALGESAARQEILNSKRQIEERTGQAVAAFAYPYGDHSEAVRRMVGEHFAIGCSTLLGFVTSASRPEALERLDVYYLSGTYWFPRLFDRPARYYLGLRRVLREWSS